MALPAIPIALKATALLIARKGAAEATKKYGKTAVKKAQEAIAKRQKAIKNKQDPTTPQSKGSQARSAETNKVKARERRLQQEADELDNILDLDNPPIDEVPLKLQSGGLLSDDRIMYKDGGEFPDLTGDGKVTQADVLKGRGVFQDGGSIDNQMQMAMNQPMLPDEEMEDNYLDFIIDEALDEEEEDMLMSKLEQDEQLSMLFDKVLEVASEFAGSGPVEGPGSGVSDSIPARLSDGEFVFTAKATEQIGADELMRMMKDAEADADRQGMQEGGLSMMKDNPDEELENSEQEIRNQMMGVNPRYQ